MPTTQPIKKTGTAGHDVQVLVDRASAWLSSSTGKQALSENVTKTVESTHRLREAQRIDPKALQEPITV